MIIRAWAIVCKGGAIHCDDESSYLFLDKGQARDRLKGDDLRMETLSEEPCAPHKIITLRGETVAW